MEEEAKGRRQIEGSTSAWDVMIWSRCRLKLMYARGEGKSISRCRSRGCPSDHASVSMQNLFIESTLQKEKVNLSHRKHARIREPGNPSVHTLFHPHLRRRATPSICPDASYFPSAAIKSCLSSYPWYA